MESSPAQKQMCSTNCKERIFNVRKVPYKQYNNQKFSKYKMSPFQEEMLEPKTLQSKKKEVFGMNMTFNAQKDLRKKYQNLKEEYHAEKMNRLQKLKQREEELTKCTAQRQRLLKQKQKLEEKRDTIKRKIMEIRERNQVLRQEQMQRNEEIRVMNMEYLRNMILQMRFQNGVDIDPDQMTYEELLELEEKMGKVSKGLSEEQCALLTTFTAKGGEDVCSICYCSVKEGEQLNLLPCKHYFHTDCLKEWVLKERVCPLCKQEVTFEKAGSLVSTQ